LADERRRAMEPLDSCRAATAIVLAGGKSSRMGTPKALLLFDETPLIVHIVSALRDLFAEVVVVASRGQELPDLSARIAYDEVAHQGPVSGIRNGLNAMATGVAATDVAFVVSCDIAFLKPQLIAHLVSLISGYDIVVPCWRGRWQPLHAVYRRSVAKTLDDHVARGELRLMSVLQELHVRIVDESEIRRFDPDGLSFFNINTPSDYDEALKRWVDASGTGR
jgi:molybdopterin-guanine dinucleotide biosynthesis protein A